MFSTPFWKKRKCHFLGSEAHHPAAKQGSKDDLNTSRSIFLLPNIYKLSSEVLTRRLCQIPDGKQPPQQVVFHYVFITTEYVLP